MSNIFRFTTLLSFPLPAGSSAATSRDRFALVALFHATGGKNWKRNTNWNTDVDLSEWCGVEVNNQGRVVKIELINNNLQGVLFYSSLSSPRPGNSFAEGSLRRECEFL